MLSNRQENVLKAIVQEYIKLAHPVGSKQICKDLKCSSATIRNEMIVLEELGYLEKAHISSGRVPSEKGYRYYVDHLMELKKMNAEDIKKLELIFQNNQLELSNVILKSLEIISDITNYTSIVLGSKSHENRLKELNIVPITNNDLVVIVITDKGYVEHKNLHLEGIELEEVKKTVNLINNLIVGTPIDEISSKLEYEVKPIIGKYVKQHEMLYNAFYNVFTDFSTKNINVVGKNNFLKHKEFNNIEKVRNIFEKLDDKNILNKIEEENNDIRIYIGKENEIDSDIAVIKTSYKTDKDEGTIAIVGPKRMEYDRVVQILDYIKENIER